MLRVGVGIGKFSPATLAYQVVSLCKLCLCDLTFENHEHSFLVACRRHYPTANQLPSPLALTVFCPCLLKCSRTLNCNGGVTEVFIGVGHVMLVCSLHFEQLFISGLVSVCWGGKGSWICASKDKYLEFS